MHQLSALDNLMVEGEIPNLPLHMSAILIYDTGGKRGSDRLRDTFLERFDSVVAQHFPILRCRVERLPMHLDRAYWVEDPDFSLSRHFSHVALPKPADWPALYRLFGAFHAQPLDTKLPLWQTVYVEGLDRLEGIPRGATAVFLKIHHAVFDGKGALRLANSFHNLGPDPDSPLLADSMAVQTTAAQDFRAPAMLAKYARAWWHSIERPMDLAGTLLKLLPQLWHGREAGAESPAQPVPRAHFNHPVAADRVAGHIAMELPVLRRLEKRYRCTINDLALCVIAGALRGYLEERYVLPAEDLVALMPIDIRDHGEEGSLGNHVSVAKISLHTRIADFSERLRVIHTETQRGKREKGGHNSRALLDLLDEVHPAVMLWLGDWLVSSGHLDDLPQTVNTVVTNVPGPPDQLYMGTARLIDYLGFGPLAPNIGLFHTVSSTAGRVNISFLSTSELIGDGLVYRDWLAASWNEISSMRKRT